MDGDTGPQRRDLWRSFRPFQGSFPLLARRVLEWWRPKNVLGYSKLAVGWAVEPASKADLVQHGSFSFADWAMNHWSPAAFLVPIHEIQNSGVAISAYVRCRGRRSA